jgi:hypothetical protein
MVGLEEEEAVEVSVVGEVAASVESLVGAGERRA